MAKFQTQFLSDSICDHESVHGFSPVVSGQSLTGSEIHRRLSSGLPVGCAVRSFNEINPFLEKFSVYDSIGNFRMRHGLVTPDELVTTPPPAEDQGSKNEPPADS